MHSMMIRLQGSSHAHRSEPDQVLAAPFNAVLQTAQPSTSFSRSPACDEARPGRSGGTILISTVAQ